MRRDQVFLQGSRHFCLSRRFPEVLHVFGVDGFECTALTRRNVFVLHYVLHNRRSPWQPAYFSLGRMTGYEGRRQDYFECVTIYNILPGACRGNLGRLAGIIPLSVWMRVCTYLCKIFFSGGCLFLSLSAEGHAGGLAGTVRCESGSRSCSVARGQGVERRTGRRWRSVYHRESWPNFNRTAPFRMETKNLDILLQSRIHSTAAAVPDIITRNIRAIGVSHTACKDEFRQNFRSHSWWLVECIFIFRLETR